MGNRMAERRTVIELVLMPLTLTVVGIAGTFFVTRQQERSSIAIGQAQLESAERQAIANRQIKMLEIFAAKITSANESERIIALRLLRAVLNGLAIRLAEAVSETESPGSPVKVVAESVASEAAQSVATETTTTSGDYFAVIASFRGKRDALDYAQGLLQKPVQYEPAVYKDEAGRYAVSLGGHLSYQEAVRRVSYAKKQVADDAFVKKSRSWGESDF